MFAMAIRMNRIKQRFRSFYNNSVSAGKEDKREGFRDTLPHISSGEEYFTILPFLQIFLLFGGTFAGRQKTKTTILILKRH